MKALIVTLIVGLTVLTVFGNNITVNNVLVQDQNQSANTVNIKFDIAWDNSWRVSTNQNNYDGAWVFVKFRKNGTSAWHHCHIKEAANVASGSAIAITSDSMGVFIHRNNDNIGIGNVNFLNNILLWNYGFDNVLDNDSVEIKVFALEMVYIPTGEFWLGSGGNESNTFKQGNTSNAYKVTSAAAIPINTSGMALNSSLGFSGASEIPATYPNGYNAYWIMKYECSQRQYADFLNCIGMGEALELVNGNTGNGSIFGQSPIWPTYNPAAPDQAYNNISKAKFLAFADWSGLRPMSEMEYEKACRGVNISPVANEYAWANTSLVNLSQYSQLENEQTANESVINTLQANALTNGSVNRPVRVGIFARPAGASRTLSGATYYGVLNMSDNVYEVTIYSGNAEGRAYTAADHGNGMLNPNGSGLTDLSGWNVTGLGLRGSYYDGDTSNARVSDRQFANWSGTGNHNGIGIRLVRSAQ